MIAGEYEDAAVSGATLLRSGFQAMMAVALSKKIDVVLAESLDRFSRDQEDTAGLFKRLTFAAFPSSPSPKQICRALNKEGVPGPQGAIWSPSTIHGNPKRGIGILHNELYVGRMVWNRQRFLKDPDTGKRVARPNPRSAWIAKEVPELRIIDDETWKAVRDRYASVQRRWSVAAKEDRFRQFRRPKYLFSGLTKCGQCGAGFIVHSREFLGCFGLGARDRGTCTNTLRISRLEVEARVLNALQTKLLRKEFFEEFCQEFAKQMNRLRVEQRAGLSSAKRELERVRREIEQVIDAICGGVPDREVKGRMEKLQERKEVLEKQIGTVNELPPLLHDPPGSL